ncbi:MAG: hypothetical protein IAF38_13405 [Bacteroidia bacterium]|nr:hypothetical protein [Bacteroidia bacterium]
MSSATLEKQNNEGTAEIYSYISRFLPLLHLPVIIINTVTSSEKLITFILSVALPVIGLTILKISSKKKKNLSWVIALLNSTFIFFICFVSGSKSPTWLTGFTWTFGMFFIFTDFFVQFAWIFYGFVLITVGSVFAGKTAIEIISTDIALLFIYFILNRTFNFLMILNKRILVQKSNIEIKNKEIMDSIYYARRIQRALITNEKYIEKNFRRLREKGK